MTSPEEAGAIFTVGEMAGLSAKLNIKLLEKYLENPQPDFKYTHICRAAIEFARIVRGEVGSSANGS